MDAESSGRREEHTNKSQLRQRSPSDDRRRRRRDDERYSGSSSRREHGNSSRTDDDRRRHRSPRSQSPSRRRGSKDDIEGSRISHRDGDRSKDSRREHRRRHSDEDSEDDRRRRRRHHRHHHDDREDDGARRERRKQRRARRDDKDGKRSSKGGGAITEFGKHGIISETDVTSRLTAEFRQWLVEERQVNPETVPRATERKLIATFVEDYNTATLPDEMYYNLEAHERRMASIRAGQDVADSEYANYDPLADERAAKASFKAQQCKETAAAATANDSAQAPSWQSKAQLEELRRVQKERVEAVKMRQLGLQTSASMGVRMDGTKFDKR